jgi:hypothetical protein
MLLLLDERTDALVVRSARPWELVKAGLCTQQLDAELARGASPDGTGPLALRAQMLARESFRRRLARSARQILAEAVRPPSSRPALRCGPAVPVCRDRVRAVAAELTELIDRLQLPGPVPVRGVAQVSVLLGDGSGPLYHRGSRDDLRARLTEAASALSQPG